MGPKLCLSITRTLLTMQDEGAVTTHHASRHHWAGLDQASVQHQQSRLTFMPHNEFVRMIPFHLRILQTGDYSK